MAPFTCAWTKTKITPRFERKYTDLNVSVEIFDNFGVKIFQLKTTDSLYAIDYT